ncbi:hypothetical protein [Dactylosporangium sp. CA-233914]|uniref:hypothetical protein n=1 Tax=Dactylosporangium sp. CA-233914 TaxID=3239934 RepID=UPI003D92C04A
MRAALLELDPATSPPRDDLIAAATMYAGLLRPHEVAEWLSLRWARYAYRSATACFGPVDERTFAAAAVLSTVMAAYRLEDAAVELREQIAARLTDRFGPAHPRVHTARVEIAVARHAAGHCVQAIDELAEICLSWARRHGGSDVVTVTTRLQLAALHDACGRHSGAARRAALAMRSYHPPQADSPAADRPDLTWITDPDHTHAVLCQHEYPRRLLRRLRDAARNPLNRRHLP